LGIGGVPFLLPLLYQIGLGYGPLMAGLLTMPLAVAAIGMKIMSRPLLKRFGHRRVLIWNTVLLGANMMLYTFIDSGTPVALIVLLSLTQGLFSSLQFTCMNSLTFADVKDEHASQASSIAGTAQQMALSFGVAFASLVAALFLQGVDQADHVRYIAGLHRTFLVLGAYTIVSSVIFGRLHVRDGNNVSQFVLRKETMV
jgi:MFS family permease